MTVETGEKRSGTLIPPAPAGRKRFTWMGPAVIWMVSAIATGELLFTPRIASLYGYSVLWMIVLAIFFKAFLAREIGRYAVVTGRSLLSGIRDLPGPRNWGVWLIVVPQFFVAVTTIVGMAGATGSALILAVPGSFRLWAAMALAVSVSLVFIGRYRLVETVSMVMSLAIALALVLASSAVFPGFAALVPGLVPRFPSGMDFVEVLPWIGFMMSGAAGLVWFSFWLPARGYGASRNIRGEKGIDPGGIGQEGFARLKRWNSLMTLSVSLASGLIFILLAALLILGSELLRPRGLLPQGPQVTDVLGNLLGLVWGPAGRWALILAAFFAFWSTMIANLDGWTRMLGQGSAYLMRQFGAGGRLVSKGFYRKLYLWGLMGALPLFLILVRPEPVRFLQMAGIVEAIHIPVVAFSTLYLNRRLPLGLRPSGTASAVTVLVGLFFLFFAVFYIVSESLR